MDKASDIVRLFMNMPRGMLVAAAVSPRQTDASCHWSRLFRGSRQGFGRRKQPGMTRNESDRF